jgi:hypothetical protein
MKTLMTCFGFAITGWGLCAFTVQDLRADTAASETVSAPAQREQTLKAALDLLATRGVVATLPNVTPTPFEFGGNRGGESLVDDGSIPLPAPPQGSPRDKIQALAQMIPATGTVSLGGSRMLLLGQKRLKLGDTYTITLEDQEYQLTINDIQTTTFTVEFQGETFRRPVLLGSELQFKK